MITENYDLKRSWLNINISRILYMIFIEKMKHKDKNDDQRRVLIEFHY